MNRFAFALSLAFAAFAARPALADAMLRPNVVVDADVLKLGDLFDNVGDKTNVVVARSPLPGRRATVDAEWLMRIAHGAGVDWRPASSFDHAVIERTGVTIGSDQIQQELSTALAAQGVPADAEIELANRGLQITVPVGVSTNVGVRDLYYDSRYKRFTATIEVPADSPSAERVRVTGRVFVTVDVPVLAHPMSRGEVITAHDLTWSKSREETLRRDVITDADQMIGLVPRQPLRSGQMISQSDLQKPVAVAKGALVTMVLKAGAMSLSAQGRALESGSVGEVIHVTNTHSNQTIEARVDGPNMVSVSLNGGLALAN